MSLPRLLLSLAAAALLAGCVYSESLFSELSESEANQMVAILRYHDYNASKVDEGKGLFSVKVYEPQFSGAIQLLRQWGYPREKTADLGELFTQSELVPTATSEEARFIFGVSQELSRTIAILDGVVEVDVHLSLATITEATGSGSGRNTGSVFLLYDPTRFSPNALTPRLRELVASGMPDLNPDDVTVLVQPVEAFDFGEIRESVRSFGKLQFRERDVSSVLGFFAVLAGINIILLFSLIVVVVRTGD